MIITAKDFELLESLYYHHYLPFDLIRNNIYKLSETYVKKRLKNLLNGNYINRFEVGSRKEKSNMLIYGLAEGGFYSVTSFGTREKFDTEATSRLKKGYLHHINSARILYAFKNEQLELNVYPERQAYHFFGDDKSYNMVLRADGAVANDSSCIFLEYENHQKSRTFENKLDKYEIYKRGNFIKNHPNINARTFEIIFVFNTENKMNNAFDKMKHIAVLKDLKVRLTTLNEILKHPMKKNIYKEVNYYEEI